MYIPQYKAIFITPQKVASTSIKRALLTSIGVKQEDWKDWEKQHDGDIPGYHKIAFVRNPFDRLVSCFHNQCLGENRYGLGNCWFKDFVQYVIGAEEVDKHFAPYQLGEVDMVCRFETLQEDWTRLRRLFPGLGTLGHENKTHERGHWTEYYDAWSLKMVREYYKQDFERLGY